MSSQMFGEDNHQHVLTNENVFEIRASNESTRTLGGKYGVSHVTIGLIKIGKRWPHLLDKPS